MGVAIAIGLMILTDAVVGGSLLRLAARTRKAPELLMGLGLFCLGPVSQLFNVLSGTGRRAVEDVSLPAHGIACVASAVGMACIFLFVRTVFRPDQRWARIFSGLSIATLAASAIWNIWNVAASPAGTPSAQVVRDPGTPILALFAASFGWAALEAGLYYLRATRQARIGLLEPVVVNRFLLWTVSSASASLLGVFLLVAHLRGAMVGLELIPSVAICVVSLVTGIGMYLAFVPPQAYLSWLRSRALPARA
jgi:hypothetical protein